LGRCDRQAGNAKGFRPLCLSKPSAGDLPQSRADGFFSFANSRMTIVNRKIDKNKIFQLCPALRLYAIFVKSKTFRFQ
jgi:hypothetical protein